MASTTIRCCCCSFDGMLLLLLPMLLVVSASLKPLHVTATVASKPWRCIYLSALPSALLLMQCTEPRLQGARDRTAVMPSQALQCSTQMQQFPAALSQKLSPPSSTTLAHRRPVVKATTDARSGRKEGHEARRLPLRLALQTKSDKSNPSSRALSQRLEPMA